MPENHLGVLEGLVIVTAGLLCVVRHEFGLATSLMSRLAQCDRRPTLCHSGRTKVEGTIGPLASMIRDEDGGEDGAQRSPSPDPPQGDQAQAPSFGSDHARQVADAQGGEIGPHHDQHAREAHALGAPAAPAHLPR